jgi:hypothetical protein
LSLDGNASTCAPAEEPGDDVAAEGFIEEDASGRIRVIHAGMPLLDSIVADLAA